MAEKQFHIQCKKGDVGKYVLLTGDPGRVERIAQNLDGAKQVIQNREFNIYTGMLENVPVSVVSTGIGGPSAAIAMEELIAIGADTFIRIGTCGGMQPELQPGCLILPSGAIRMEGTTKEYMPIEFPAVPNFGLLSNLVQAAEEFEAPYHVGIVQCKDSFYGQHSPEIMPVHRELMDKWEAWKIGGALGSEMESAALFVLAAVRHVKCATVLQMLWNQEQKKVDTSAPDQNGMEDAIQVAIQAIKLQIRKDSYDKTLLCGR